MLRESPRVFISYAWEDDEYRLWVKRLATRLREDGVDARLDAWHLGATDSVPDFMNREIRQARWVLVLCSPTYRSKVHETENGMRMTGVGWEARLLSGRWFAVAENKVIAALARGTWSQSAPDFLLGARYDDLSDPQTFEVRYRDLLRHLTGTSEKAPPLGTLPSDLEPEPVEPLRGSDLMSEPANGTSPKEQSEETRRSATTELTTRKVGRKKSTNSPSAELIKDDSKSARLTPTGNASIQGRASGAPEPVGRNPSKARLLFLLTILAFSVASVKSGFMHPFAIGWLIFSGFISASAAKISADQERHVKFESPGDSFGNVAPLSAGPLISLWIFAFAQKEDLYGGCVATVLGVILSSIAFVICFSLVVGGILHLFLLLLEWRPVVSLSAWLIIAALVGGTFATPIALAVERGGLKASPKGSAETGTSEERRSR